jgi:hypothetical protein
MAMETGRMNCTLIPHSTPNRFHLTCSEPSEAAVLDAILQALAVHPAVGGFWRQNTGAFVVGEGKSRRFVRFGPKGSPDIHGYLKDGRALFIEVKKPSGRVSPEQQAFIDRAIEHHALAFTARSVSDVFRVLGSGDDR